MATILLGGYMVRYPLGGMLSWQLQFLVGLQALGHDVYFVEKYAYPNSCYDPSTNQLSSDCTYGLTVVADLLTQHGLDKKWCYVGEDGTYHGLPERAITDVFRRTDLYIENGAHGAWQEEAMFATLRVYVESDPAFTQIKFYNQMQKGGTPPDYHYFYTNGMNVGQPGNLIPTNGIAWRYLVNPVHTQLFTENRPHPPKNAPYSTVMNWKSYDQPVVYEGVAYGHKNQAFETFISLPKQVSVPLEMAVSGLNTPDRERVAAQGWLLTDAHQASYSFAHFKAHINRSRAEFSVCKHMYTATNSGWFSDKSAAYLASGRPVILQETGFSAYLPVGEGLFSFKTPDEARAAIEEVNRNYGFHAKKAVELAGGYLEARTVFARFLAGLGI